MFQDDELLAQKNGFVFKLLCAFFKLPIVAKKLLVDVLKAANILDELLLRESLQSVDRGRIEKKIGFFYCNLFLVHEKDVLLNRRSFQCIFCCS